MPTLITGTELVESIKSHIFIDNGDPNCAEGIKYDFRLSNIFLKSKFTRPVSYNDLTETEKKEAVINPGEVVFVLTEERLSLPENIFVQLSPKRKLSHAGILILGGLAIDPGYKGKLLFGLYNFSSTPFPIIPGKKLIGATFYKLIDSEIDKFPPPPPPLDEFPEELIRMINEYEPIVLQHVAKDLSNLERRFDEIYRTVSSHENWTRRFEEYLDSHNTQIGKITKGLEDEITARLAGQNQLTEAINSIKNNFAFLRGVAWILGIMGGVALALLIAGLTKLLGWY
jgi:deoxycytidine triphosphate deaminase